MIEIPEARVIAAQLRQAVVGAEIREAVAAQSPHGFAWYYGDPADYGPALRGRRVLGVRGFGNYVQLDLDDYTLAYGEGARLRLLKAGQPRPAKHQLLIEFADGTGLVCTVQMYAAMMAFPPGGLDDNPYYMAALEKIDPLEDAFDQAHFDGIYAAASPKLSAKALLATEQRIPGLGNGVLQDILYHAGVHPRTAVGALDAAALGRLYDSVKQTLKEMVALGGRNTERTLFGEPGGYETIMCAKTAGGPCPRCGAVIEKANYLGGSVYWCPDCQPRL